MKPSDGNVLMRKKNSIRTKILRVTLLLLLTFAIVMGAVGIVLVNKLSKEDSRLIMRQICDKETLRFDNKLSAVEQSVDMIYEYAQQLRKIKGYDYDVYSDEYSDLVQNLALSVADRTDGAMAVYFRLNPEMTGDGTSGFFWSKHSEDTGFCEEPPTDILAYNSNDIEHVGWFYTTKEAGEPLWMTPYYNQNLDVFMISYIVPFYLENGEFVGVIGIDIDFNSVMKVAGEVDLYETGEVALVDMSEHLVYYADDSGNAKKEKLSNALYNHITTINKSDELLEVIDPDGKVSVLCCDGLSNGMKLFVSVPLEEINKNRNKLILWYVVISAFMFFVAVVMIQKNTARIIKPLNRLTQITNRYAQGDWTENYISNTSDEIQELSEGIATMADTTQSYIAHINKLARTDGLTGLKNKTCYLEYIEKLVDNRQKDFEAYAVVVMDLNYLKVVNDNYGHEMGDKLIKAAGEYISGIFSHSDVFRIGGDEYVAILQGEDYEKRLDLCREFEQRMDCEIPDAEGIKLSISYGMASYDEDGTGYEELFRLADDRMYEKKKLMKMVRKG